MISVHSDEARKPSKPAGRDCAEIAYLLPGLGGPGRHSDSFITALSDFFDVRHIDYLPGLDRPCSEGADLAAGVARASAAIFAEVRGPFALIGYSAGGYAAVQVASALGMVGKQPSVVVLLDSAIGAESRAPRRRRLASHLLQTNPLRLVHSAVTNTAIDNGFLDPARLFLLLSMQMLGRSRFHNQVIRLYGELWKRAVASSPLKAYDGNVLLCSSQRQNAEVMAEQWQEYCPRLLHLALHGDHWSMMLSPLVDCNTRPIADYLKEALSNPAGEPERPRADPAQFSS